jgi:hypothetical protein
MGEEGFDVALVAIPREPTRAATTSTACEINILFKLSNSFDRDRCLDQQIREDEIPIKMGSEMG